MLGVLYLCAAAPLAVWEAFALTQLWFWFLVPLGVPAITLAQGVGISLIAAILTHQIPRGEADDEHILTVLAVHLVMPPVALLIGWVAKTVL